jgi:hypothetical protein
VSLVWQGCWKSQGNPGMLRMSHASSRSGDGRRTNRTKEASMGKWFLIAALVAAMLLLATPAR